MPKYQSEQNSVGLANTPTASLSSTSVPAISLNLPSFVDLKPRVWFAVFETEIHTKNVVSDYDKYSHLIPRLPKEFLQVIEHVILNPPAEGKYELVKHLILEAVEPTAKATLDQLFAASELGDRTPSALLREIRGMAGSHVDEYFLKELWLRRLPPQVQAIVAIQLHKPLNEVASAADIVAERLQVTATTSKLSQDRETNDLLREIEALRVSNTRLPGPSQASRTHIGRSPTRYLRRSSPYRFGRKNDLSPARQKPQPNDELCWYHQRFGLKAKRCKQPCPLYGVYPQQGN